MQRFIIAGSLVVAVALAAVTGFLGAGIGVLAACAMLPLPIIFKDYRAGVIMLTLVLPGASALPNIPGLNLLNFLTFATLASFLTRTAFQRRPFVKIPLPVFLAFVLPVTMGIIVAYPHIHEAVNNYPLLTNAQDIYNPPKYVVERYVKPLLYYYSYMFLLANAVRDSKRPERFLALLSVSVLVPVLLVVYTIATYPGSLSELVGNREFMAPRGMHANEFGMLIAFAAGPLLFSIGTLKSRLGNFMLMVMFAITSLGVVLTLSRGGLLSYLIAVAAYLVTRRQVKVMIFIVLFAVAGLLVAPSSVTDRFMVGIHSGAVSDVEDISKDELTAGRVGGWIKLLPEVHESPIWGRGLGSTQWSEAVEMGIYAANHPHNIYLEVLMDLGIIGVGAFFYLYYRYLNRYRRLVRDRTLSPTMQAFFDGSRWSMVGGLVMAATTAYYMPNQAQFFMWFSLGILMAYWDRADYKEPVPAGMRRMLGVRRSGIWGSVGAAPNVATRAGSAGKGS